MRVVYTLVAVAASAIVAISLTFNSAADFAKPTYDNPAVAPARPPVEIGIPEIGGFVTSESAQDADNEPDVLLMALLTVGAAAGAGALALIGYVVRNRIGFWLHRPPPREGGAPDEHH